MNDWIWPNCARSSLSALLMMVTQCKEIRALSHRSTPDYLLMSWDWNLITMCLKSELISLWSFRLFRVLVITASSLFESIQSRDSVSSAVRAWVRTVPRDLETLTFLDETEVSLDSRFSSSSKRDSWSVWGISYLVNTALTLAFPSSSIPITWYWSASFLFAVVLVFAWSAWLFDDSTISFWTLPASSKSFTWDFLIPNTDPCTKLRLVSFIN